MRAKPFSVHSVICAAIAISAGGPVAAQVAAPLEPSRVALDKLPVTARVAIPSSADWITFGFGSVWVVNYRPDRVSRIDTATNRVTADIPVGRNGCLGIVAGVDRVWVPTCGDGVINEIDPKTDSIVRRIPAPIKRGREGAFAFAGGSLWILDNVSDSASSTVARIAANAPTQAGDISAGGGFVWLSVDGLPVTRIDPRTNTVTHPFVGGSGADAIRWGAGAVWVADHKVGQLWRIDAAKSR